MMIPGPRGPAGAAGSTGATGAAGADGAAGSAGINGYITLSGFTQPAVLGTASNVNYNGPGPGVGSYLDLIASAAVVGRYLVTADTGIRVDLQLISAGSIAPTNAVGATLALHSGPAGATGATGATRHKLEQVTTDFTTGSATYVDVLVMSYTSTKSELILDATICFDMDSDANAHFRITVDGATKIEGGFHTTTDATQGAALSTIVSSVAAGAHSIRLQTKADSGGTVNILSISGSVGACKEFATLRVSEADPYS